MSIRNKLLLAAALAVAAVYVAQDSFSVEDIDRKLIKMRVDQVAERVERKVERLNLERLASDDAFPQQPSKAQQDAVDRARSKPLSAEDFGRIRELLDDELFDDGQGYYFLYTLDPTAAPGDSDGECWVVHHEMKRLLGQNAWSLREEKREDGRALVQMVNTAVQNDGEGFFNIRWPSLMEDGRVGPYEDKLIYVRGLDARFYIEDPVRLEGPQRLWIGSGILFDQSADQLLATGPFWPIGLFLAFTFAIMAGVSARVGRLERSARALNEQLYSSSGKIRHEQLSAELIRDPSNDEIGRIANAFDELAKRVVQEANFRSALWDCVPDGLAVTDAQSEVVDANEALLDMYRLDRDHLTGRSIADFLPEGESFERYEEDALRPVLEEGRVVRLPYARRVRGDGSEVFVSISVAAIEGTNYRVHSLTDRTADHRWLRATRLNASGRLLSGIVHALGQPGFRLKCAVDAHDDDPASVERTVRVAREVSSLLDRYMGAFRRFALAEKQEEENFWMSDAVRDAALLTTSLLTGLGAELRFRGGEQVGRVFGYQGRAIVVLMNLIENAALVMRDAGSEQRVVEVSIAAGARWVEVVVSDTGPGLPKALADPAQLFELGYTRRDKGGGLGLALCKEIMANDFQGSTLARNGADGGARFELRFPRREELSDGT
ncbi:MAG: ATP-binding protein [Planctomycetota bacterium]